jgi:hypothetical protein
LSKMTGAERAESESETESEQDHGEGQQRLLTCEAGSVCYVHNKLKQNYIIREGW